MWMKISMIFYVTFDVPLEDVEKAFDEEGY